MLRVPTDSVRPGIAGRRNIDSPYCRSLDGYYERSGKCREPSRVLEATGVVEGGLEHLVDILIN